jgi:flagellar protein FlaF
MSTKAALRNRLPAEGDPRKTESWALLEVARQLEDARRSRSKEAILAAAGLNWRLWIIFGESLGDPACGLPQDLRVNMLLLANFVDRRTAEILSDPRPERVDALVRINLQVGGGMLGKALTDGAAPTGRETRAREVRPTEPRRTGVRMPNAALSVAK